MQSRQVRVPTSAVPVGALKANFLYLNTILASVAHRILHRRDRHQSRVAADYDAGEWSQQRQAKHWASASSLLGYADKEWRGERIVAEMDGRLWSVPATEYYAYRRERLTEILGHFAGGEETLFELGSGTGSNLFALAPSGLWPRLVGLEISPTGREVAREVAQRFGVGETIAIDTIDLLDPNSEGFQRIQGGVVFTHYCLEQLPNHTETVFRNIAAAGVRRAIMIEPSFELLDRRKISDLASLTYVLRQDYQRSILRTARELEKEGVLKIVEIRRLDFVSGFRNDPTLLVWDLADGEAASR